MFFNLFCTTSVVLEALQAGGYCLSMFSRPQERLLHLKLRVDDYQCFNCVWECVSTICKNICSPCNRGYRCFCGCRNASRLFGKSFLSRVCTVTNIFTLVPVGTPYNVYHLQKIIQVGAVPDILHVQERAYTIRKMIKARKSTLSGLCDIIILNNTTSG